MTTIRILLIDDHTLFRSGVRALLQRQPDFEVVDDAADGIEGVKRAKQHRPDVVLLDLNMPGLSGIETLQLLKQDLPDTAVVMLTVSEDVDELAKALGEGACGYLLKNIEAETLSSAIRRAAAGEAVVADDMTARLVEKLRSPARTGASARGSDQPVPDAPRGEWSALTPRERDIVRSLSRGASNKDIARELEVAESTVKIHVRNVLRKLKLSSRVQIAIYALEQDAGEVR
ncbi:MULTISPECIES: response regulator [unclassified Caballeronia]|uniref:response regulator n=1 Tax=unclassified Caballeronia TaxID=2646786 RepID=UPI002866CC8A|nr:MULTISPECIES: response regulator [unclassified Caballeronia]MDR5754115.1 response regulator [Caballeronia sp. LZ024]MDR5840493.1 response regulator [Caballeronia sp. LZ031]